VPALDEAPQIVREAPSAAPMLLDEPSAAYATGSMAADALALTNPAGHVRALDEIEAEVIRFAIARYRGQMSEVARRLHIGRSTLYRKLDEIGLGAEAAREGSESVASG
jgi:DNA-binding NtrC family response regulator